LSLRDSQLLAVFVSAVIPLAEFSLKWLAASFYRPSKRGDLRGWFDYEMTSGRTFGGLGWALTGIGFAVVTALTVNLLADADRGDRVARLIEERDLVLGAFVVLGVSAGCSFLAFVTHVLGERDEWPRRQNLVRAVEADARLGQVRSRSERLMNQSRVMKYRFATLGFGLAGLAAPLMVIFRMAD
jgi:hypothetical protein